MKYKDVLARLQSYEPPAGWAANVFLLPEPVMRKIYDHILANQLKECVELGTGFGATSCVMAAALEETAGRLTTIDMYLHQPVNVRVLMEHTGVDAGRVDVVVDPLGYNWYLADLIEKRTKNDFCTPLFDFCLLDGAHEWEPDALAFSLIAKLLNPGAWIALDDINFKLRMISNWQETHADRSDRELDTFQLAMVFNIMVRQHPDFGDFSVIHDGRVGWARKHTTLQPTSLRARLARFIARL